MSTEKERDTLYTITQAAQVAGVPLRTMYHAVNRELIKVTKIAGKKFVSQGAIDDWKANPELHKPGPK